MEVDGRLLQVVSEQRTHTASIATGQGGQQTGVDSGGPGRADAVELPEHRRGGQAVVAQRQHPLEAAAHRHGLQFLSPPGADGGAAVQQEGHVGAEPGRESVELPRIQARPPQLVAGDQGGGGVGRSPGHASRDGDAFVNPDLRPEVSRPAGPGQQPGRADHEVGVVGGQTGGALAPETHPEHPGLGGSRHQVVEQRHRLEQGSEGVIALVVGGSDVQRQVHLGRHPHPHFLHGLNLPVVCSRWRRSP